MCDGQRGLLSATAFPVGPRRHCGYQDPSLWSAGVHGHLARMHLAKRYATNGN